MVEWSVGHQLNRIQHATVEQDESNIKKDKRIKNKRKRPDMMKKETRQEGSSAGDGWERKRHGEERERDRTARIYYLWVGGEASTARRPAGCKCLQTRAISSGVSPLYTQCTLT